MTITEKLSGIVLGGVSVGENDKILNVFTLQQGVVSAKIKGVKKAGANVLVAGSAVFNKSDRAEAIRLIRES